MIVAFFTSGDLLLLNSHARIKDLLRMKSNYRPMSSFMFVCAVRSLFLGSIDPSRKDNRHIDLQAQQLAWFTHQFRLILYGSWSRRRIAMTDS